MKFNLLSVTCLSLLLLCTTGVKAQPGSLDKLETALKDANWPQALLFVNDSGINIDKAGVALSQYALQQILTNPHNAAESLALLKSVGDKLTLSSGAALAPLFKQILGAVKNASSKSCAGDAQNGSGATEGTLASAYNSVMGSLGSLALLPTLVAADQGLYAEIKATNSDCIANKGQEDAQLAQTPSGPPSQTNSLTSVYDLPENINDNPNGGDNLPPSFPPGPPDDVSPN